MTFNILLILSGLLGYIILIITFKNSKYNKILNSFLLVIIFISSTLLLIAGISVVNNDFHLKAFYLKIDIYTSLFLPSFYLYFKYLVRNQKKIIYADILSFLFLLLVIVEREFLVFDKIVGFQLNYNFSQFLAIYALVYNTMIFLMLKNNVWNKKATLSYAKSQNNLIKQWSILLFIALIAFSLRFYILYYHEYLFLKPRLLDYSFRYLWVTAFVWIILFVIILSNPEILYGYSYLKAKSSKTNFNLKNNNYWHIKSKVKIKNNQDLLLKEKLSFNIENYINKLNDVLYNNTYFAIPDFSIKDLALELNIPVSHLKFVFKYHSELSFSDYKNVSRIQNSLELINNNYLVTNTLDSLSRKVGFSSYNPFFSCFKDVVGKSPQEYISTMKNDL